MPAFRNARRLLMCQVPPIAPVLDFNFLSGSLDGRATFTRSTAGWAYSSAGVLTSTATNVPRFDYNPSTLALRGLLLEEARTNSCRNNSMTGVAAGTPGTLCTNWTAAATATGITRTIVGSGTVNGLPYVDIKYTGTATAGDTVLFFDSTTGVATVNATIWTSSVFVALVAGSLTNVTPKQGIRYRGAAGVNLAAQLYETSFVPTSTLTRYERTGTASDATVAFVVNSLNLTMASGAVDLTLRIAAPQLELGSFATSPILTTAGAVLRAADVCSALTSTFAYNELEGTLFAAYTPIGVTGLQTAVYLDDGTNNERMGVRASSGALAAVVVDGGVSQASVGGGSQTAIATKVAMAYRLNDIALVVNGVAGTTDTSATLPTVTKLQIGSRTTSTEPMSGWYTQVSYFNQRLLDASLLRIAA